MPVMKSAGYMETHTGTSEDSTRHGWGHPAIIIRHLSTVSVDPISIAVISYF